MLYIIAYSLEVKYAEDQYVFPFFSVDSVLLLEEGFSVASCDASDKMLKYALKTRWERRKEEAFDKWGL